MRYTKYLNTVKQLFLNLIIISSVFISACSNPTDLFEGITDKSTKPTSLLGETNTFGSGLNGTETQITNDGNSKQSVSISGNKIVWNDFRSGNSDVYLFDLTTGTEKQITNNSDHQRYPDISGNKIVWEDNRGNSTFYTPDIYLYDLDTDTEIQITSNSSSQRFPRISGNYIVWEDFRNGNWDIYAYDLSTGIEIQITNNSFVQNRPSVSGDRIVWQDTRNGNFDIYMYDLSTGIETQITDNEAAQLDPAISEDLIVWNHSSKTDNGIYLHDLATGIETQVVSNEDRQFEPAISGDNVVWGNQRTEITDSDTDGKTLSKRIQDIYLYNLSTKTTHQITDDDASQLLPAISGERIVWLDGRNNGILEIYLYELVTNNIPLASPGGPYSDFEGDVVSFDGNSSSDPDNDILSYEWDFNYDGTTFNVDATGPAPNYTYQDNGSYTAALRVNDGIATSEIAITSVTIANVDPSVNNFSGIPIDPIPIGTTVSITANFSDPGVLDTHTGTIDWNAGGEALLTNAVITETDGSGTASGSYTYNIPGVYSVKVTVYDNDQGQGTLVDQYIVVFDPNAGFVTGGGWINSPLGAYSNDLTLTGKASFGFVSKYKNGANTPTGKTQFQFKAGNLNFHSTIYDWLVIAGSKAMFKGTGSINGSQYHYGFMLSAVDGSLSGGAIDKFRIKIWDKVSEEIIYDNQMGEDDNSDLTTNIAKGNIVIHKKGT